MTRSKPFDQILEAWLDEGPELAPRELLESVLIGVRSRQQHGHRFGALRRFPMLSTTVQRAGAIAAVVVVAVVGLAIAGRGQLPTGVGGATPTPGPTSIPTSTPSSAASVGPSPTNRVAGAIVISDGTVLRAATTYTTTLFTPVFTFVGQDGWQLQGSDASSAVFWAGGDIGQGLFELIRPGQVLDVGGVAAPVPADLVAWLESRSDLVLGTATTVQVGGFSGTLLDGTVRAGSQVNGGNAINIACQVGIEVCTFGSPAALGFAADNHFQLVVVTVRGQTLLIDMTASSAAWSTARPHLEAFLAGLKFPAGG